MYTSLLKTTTSCTWHPPPPRRNACNNNNKIRLIARVFPLPRCCQPFANGSARSHHSGDSLAELRADALLFRIQKLENFQNAFETTRKSLPRGSLSTSRMVKKYRYSAIYFFFILKKFFSDVIVLFLLASA